MTELEIRTLARASILLLVAAGLRWGWDARRPPPLFPPDSAGVLPALLAASDSAHKDDSLRSRPLAASERLDPNRASAAELDRLPGVGPATAAAVVASRAADGPFRRPEDLTRVKGIGASAVRRMAPHLDFGAGDPPAPRAVPPARTTVVDLNRATAAELESLPGVGPALAGRIVALRARKGRFARVDDLLEVAGIGPATLERIRKRVRVR